MAAFIRFFTSLFSFGRGLFAFLLFFGLSYAILHSSLKDKLWIVQKSVSTVLYPAQLVVNQVSSWDRLESDNRMLKTVNARLRIENDLLRQQFLRIRRMDAMSDVKQVFGDSTLSAEVVAKNPGRLLTSILVNEGEEKGISRNMPAFTSAGLVGKVSKVFGGHSVVQLLTDPQSKVSVLENRTRVSGILESYDSRVLFVEFPAHANIKTGDTLVTSGLGGVFPKGIRVGLVSKLTSSDIAVMRRAEVNLFQIPSEVEELFVLRKDVDWVVRGFSE